MLLKQFLYVLLTVLIHSNNVLSADPVVPPAGQVAPPANPAAQAPAPAAPVANPPVANPAANPPAANPAANPPVANPAATPAATPEEDAEADTTETALTPDEADPVETTPTVATVATTATTPATVPEAVKPTTETTETPIAPAAATVETSSSSTTTPLVPPNEDLTDTTNTALTKTGTTTTPVVDTETTETKTSSSTSSSSSSSEKPKETINPDLVSDKIFGTWSSKANTVFTGPGFYDPVDELLIEPALPGISYSFTEDGYWEEAIYQVSPNPRNHSCPAAVLIFQHGTYTMGSNGSLILTPFEVDGRQLLSEPCKDGGISIYSRYKQIEEFKGYQVYVDPYHGRWRLDLIKSNGEIMQPLYLAYQPPQMLPTITMNPTAASTGKSKRELNENGNEIENEFDLSLAGRIRRSLENQYKTNAILKDSTNYVLWWWCSVTMIAIGAGLFVFS